jgi:hypothetical protein
LREVTNAGVQHVMGLFMHHYAANEETQVPLQASSIIGKTPAASAADVVARVGKIADIICDEEALDR